MQRGFDRVFGAAVGITGRSDPELIARQEVHGQATDFLAGVVGDGDYFAVATSLRIDFVKPGVVLGLICKTGEILRTTHSRFPINTHRQPRLPARRCAVTATSPATLVRADDVDTRTAVHTEAVDRPVGVIDGFERTGLSTLHEYSPDHGADSGEQTAFIADMIEAPAGAAES